MTPVFPLLGMAMPSEGESLLTTQAANPVSPWEKAKDAVAVTSAALGSPGMLMDRVKTITGGFDLFSGWFGPRGVTMIVGLLLLAAAFFSHPAVREKIVVAGKAAGKAAALAA